MPLFRNRMEAGEDLASKLAFLAHEKPIVLGLGAGGLQVAEIVAKKLDAPLDVLLIERLYAPNARGHIVGAVDEHGRISMIQSTARWHHLNSQQMIEPAREAFLELQRRSSRIRRMLPELEVRGRTVIIVSEGINTGATMLGALASVRDRGARRIIAAAPAGHSKATWQLHELADMVVIPHQPNRYESVNKFYKNFPEVTDDMMLASLERWVSSRQDEKPGVRTFSIKITSTKGQTLSCELDLPPDLERGSGPYPAVIFVHGFESDGRSPRSVPISRRLAKRGVVGARLDFTGHGRSEGTIEDATDRQMLEDLHVAFTSIAQLQEVDEGRMGLNGAGSGAMIALLYAAQQPLVRTMVIRGPICGREVSAARKITAPTLLIHAERDTALEGPIEKLNRELGAVHELLRIPNSNRLFSDPISMELMVNASVDWLADHLLALPPTRLADGAVPEVASESGSPNPQQPSHQPQQTRAD
jgi:putative phosphoribosyl transferase